jgi:crotonobetainyl-CoA:carnitine CoA-transferase CaiB-like acyl-CoA transferase
LANQDLIDEHLIEWFAQLSDVQAVEILWSAGVPVALTPFPHEQDELEQLKAREYFVRLEHPVTGMTTYNELPFKLGGGPHRLTRTPAPTLGQHNREVLVDLLGVDPTEYEQLEEGGVIGSAVRGKTLAF